jgi:predicted nucleotidyltransferase
MDYNLFVDKIKNSLPAGQTLLYASITGSRSHGMASSTSDYDMKCIIHSSHDLYMLQRAPQSIRINTEINGVPLEGTATDILQMLRFARDTNPMAAETFGGIEIFTTERADEIKRIYLKAYRPEVLRKAWAGQIHGYLMKPGKQAVMNTNKGVMAIANLALRLIFISRVSQTSPPPLNIKKLMQMVDLLPDTQAMIQEMLENRIGDKNA